jgi:UDP-N-acetylmuramoyl-L-alanyl-D-glutamate--2,6-diaminopimelate ligase
MLAFIRNIIPLPLFRILQAPYHYVLAALGAVLYGFPSRNLIVIGVTGTKGKSSTAELISAVLEEAGYTTALASTIRFKIGNETRPNTFKMTMPGRLFLQRFFREAVTAGCHYAVIEMTSEGVTQFRHKFIDLSALIVTSITPEHIEAHGSYEAYVAAKLQLRDLLEQSKRHHRWMVMNVESAHADEFLDVHKAIRVPYKRADAEPYHIRERGIDLTFEGVYIHSPLVGGGNLENILAAATFCRTQGIDTHTIKRAIEKLFRIPGRGERIDAGQPFDIIVDYAHTAESLEQLYQTFGRKPLVCVLGSTGGGRDRWKRPRMGELADKYCSVIILTNEDPYDESPEQIVTDIARGMSIHTPRIVMDRREAIREAYAHATHGSAVLITGKGTDPFIMGPHGTRLPWSDAAVAREEIALWMQQKGVRKNAKINNTHGRA